jgi:hypothetical protein
MPKVAESDATVPELWIKPEPLQNNASAAVGFDRQAGHFGMMICN